MSEADKKATWNTAITRIEPNRVGVRGYDIAELMGRVSFGAAVYLILTGELPSPAIARLMDAILVASIDHGATPPSALAARTVASTGAALSAAVAAGIMSINRHHGGAIEDCARQLKAIADRATRESISLDEAADAHAGSDERKPANACRDLVIVITRKIRVRRGFSSWRAKQVSMACT